MLFKILGFESNKNSGNKAYTFVTHKWQDNLKDTFRRVVIGKLPQFSQITDTIDVHCRNSVNECVEMFTELLNSTAEPLFDKTVNVGNNSRIVK